MKRIPLALAAALLAAPAFAQDEDTGRNGLIDQGAEMILRGLIEEVAPPLQELAGIGQEVLPTFQLLANEMGPAFVDVINQIDNITYYEPPVIAPNGDIVLRRRADAPAWIPREANDDSAGSAEDAPAPREQAPAPQGEEAPAPSDEVPSDNQDPGFDLTPPPEAESTSDQSQTDL